MKPSNGVANKAYRVFVLIFLVSFRASTVNTYGIGRNIITGDSLLLSSQQQRPQQQEQYQQHRLQYQQQSQPMSSLASKVIFQSAPPSLANVYKEILVSSKPLNLHKYPSGMKTKKTKKDSKIYFIPIPPMPYRFIPGVGYDYQPMKINPIMKEKPTPIKKIFVGNTNNKVYDQTEANYTKYALTEDVNRNMNKNKLQIGSSITSINNILSPTSFGYGANAIRPIVEVVPSLNTSLSSSSSATPLMTSTTSVPLSTLSPVSPSTSTSTSPSISTATSTSNESDDSKIYYIHHANYHFNGRPFRLQVAHAQRKHQITPQNLKSKFYFNKNIIY